MNATQVNSFEAAEEYCKDAIAEQQVCCRKALKNAKDFEDVIADDQGRKVVRAFGAYWWTPGLVWIDKGRDISVRPYELLIAPDGSRSDYFRLPAELESVVESHRTDRPRTLYQVPCNAVDDCDDGKTCGCRFYWVGPGDKQTDAANNAHIAVRTVC